MRRRLPWMAGALLVSVAGCKKATEPVLTPGSMTLVQGGGQQLQGGLELPNPIVVRLLDIDGKPLPDYPIGFVVSKGGGTVNPGSALTDASGEVKTKWTLGPSEISQTLDANAGILEPLVISATAILPTDLVVAQGANQTAKPSGALTNPILIRVLGPNNVPMKGITVAFQVTQGGGLISPASGLTNALGEVQAKWTLGPVAGTNALVVSSGSLQSLSILAVAQ